MDRLISPELLPYTVALAILATLVAVQVLSLVAGMDLGEGLDDVLPSPEGLSAGEGFVAGLGTVLEWLLIGRVPLLALIALFLFGFAAGGYLSAVALRPLPWAWVPVWATAPFAVAGGAIVSRTGGRMLARMAPGDASSAVSVEALAGRGGVLISPSAPGRWTQVRVADDHGQDHWLLGTPDDDLSLDRGARVIVVDVTGTRCTFIRDPSG